MYDYDWERGLITPSEDRAKHSETVLAYVLYFRGSIPHTLDLCIISYRSVVLNLATIINHLLWNTPFQAFSPRY